jgi:small subunit ribosomal protein S6
MSSALLLDVWASSGYITVLCSCLADPARPNQTEGGRDVRAYEAVYIFDTTLPDEAVEQRLDRYQQLLTGDGKGEITAVDRWGKRQLAYPIAKRTSGNYVVVQFKADTAALPEFERILKLDEGLLRYLIVLHEGEPIAPMSLATREPRSEEDEDEEEDEE